MRRRTLLEAIAAALPTVLAGCRDSGQTQLAHDGVAELPPLALRMEPIDDADLPSRTLYSVSEGRDERAQLVTQAVDGSTTRTATRPPLPEDRKLAYDGTVYELSHEIVEETPATQYSVKVDIVTDSVDEDAVIQFADLPNADKTVFEKNGLAGGEVIGIGTTILYTDAQRDQSVLVPDSEYSYITWDHGAEAEWVVDDAYETTLNTYRYTGEELMSASEYGQRMRDEFAFELTDLTDDQRTVVETAIGEDRYTVDQDETVPDHVTALVDRFRDQDHARDLSSEATESRDGVSGPYLVQYDGEVYWTNLRVDVSAMNSPQTGGANQSNLRLR